MSSSSGVLVLAATPIGDPADAPPRLAALLATADVIAAEDTRRFRRLAAALGVTPSGRVLSYQEHNEAGRSAELVSVVAGGGTVVVVTDAGMPSVSDPGLRVVRAAIEAGLPVTAVPGPSAVLTALALSGLPTDRFCFEGFPSRKPGERRRSFDALASEPRTMVFFEAPHRVAPCLADLAAALGPDRPAALCRELTKTYEEVVRLPLGALATWASDSEPRGEITLVVGGAPPPTVDMADPDDVARLVADVQARVSSGERLKDAVSEVAARSGANKRALYDASVRASKP